MLVTGSFISGLMVWRELDIMFLGGPELSPTDVLAAMGRLVVLPGNCSGSTMPMSAAFAAPPESLATSGTTCPRPTSAPTGTWCLDLTFWLHDAHENVTVWHQQLPRSLTPEERSAILRIKDVWHRRPDYPDAVGGLEIYTSVLKHGIRSPEQFDDWLTKSDLARAEAVACFEPTWEPSAAVPRRQ